MQTIKEVQKRGSELSDVELKPAAQGTPKDIDTTICAFANRRGGGQVLFGIDSSFRVVGVGNLDRLQADIAAAAAQIEPPVRIEMRTETVHGKTVLSALVPEVDPQFRPAFIRARGPYTGAYVRTGDGDRRMTQYEVDLALSSRRQTAEDLLPVDGSTLADLDDNRIDMYVAGLRSRQSPIMDLAQSRMELLSALNITTQDDPPVPTLAGLLVFGTYPQRFFPSLVITVSIVDAGGGASSARFSSDVRCEGPIMAMLEHAQAAMARAMRRRLIVSGLLHEEVPEYPPLALREALTNAVVHRDYSRYAVGMPVHVRFYDDRVEIQNPGGLYGPVSIDLLGELGVQATRNVALCRLLEDLGPMENRGTGVAAITAAMRSANLEPPQFRDAVTYFRLTLRNTAVVNEDSAKWLGRFAALALNDRERLALVFLRRHGSLSRPQYRALTGATDDQAAADLMHLTHVGLVERNGERGLYVFLHSEVDEHAKPHAAATSLSKSDALVLRNLDSVAPRRASDLQSHTGLSRSTVNRCLRKLVTLRLAAPTQAKARASTRAYVRVDESERA